MNEFWLIKTKNSDSSYLKAGRACNDCLGVSKFDWFGGIAACGLNRFGHIQVFMVAINAKLQRIFETAIGYAVKHNRLSLKSLLFTRVRDEEYPEKKKLNRQPP
ncbi:MAG: hypothetical protein ACI305_07145 [Lepagella sp.]